MWKNDESRTESSLVGWNIEQLGARAHERLMEHGGVDPEAFARLSGLLRYVTGAYTDPAARALPGDPAVSIRHRYSCSAFQKAQPDTCLAPRASCQPLRPLGRQHRVLQQQEPTHVVPDAGWQPGSGLP